MSVRRRSSGAMGRFEGQHDSQSSSTSAFTSPRGRSLLQRFNSKDTKGATSPATASALTWQAPNRCEILRKKYPERLKLVRHAILSVLVYASSWSNMLFRARNTSQADEDESFNLRGSGDPTVSYGGFAGGADVSPLSALIDGRYSRDDGRYEGRMEGQTNDDSMGDGGEEVDENGGGTMTQIENALFASMLHAAGSRGLSNLVSAFKMPLILYSLLQFADLTTNTVDTYESHGPLRQSKRRKDPISGLLLLQYLASMMPHIQCGVNKPQWAKEFEVAFAGLFRSLITFVPLPVNADSSIKSWDRISQSSSSPYSLSSCYVTPNQHLDHHPSSSITMSTPSSPLHSSSRPYSVRMRGVSVDRESSRDMRQSFVGVDHESPVRLISIRSPHMDMDRHFSDSYENFDSQGLRTPVQDRSGRRQHHHHPAGSFSTDKLSQLMSHKVNFYYETASDALVLWQEQLSGHASRSKETETKFENHNQAESIGDNAGTSSEESQSLLGQETEENVRGKHVSLFLEALFDMLLGSEGKTSHIFPLLVMAWDVSGVEPKYMRLDGASSLRLRMSTDTINLMVLPALLSVAREAASKSTIEAYLLEPTLHSTSSQSQRLAIAENGYTLAKSTALTIVCALTTLFRESQEFRALLKNAPSTYGNSFVTRSTFIASTTAGSTGEKKREHINVTSSLPRSLQDELVEALVQVFYASAKSHVLSVLRREDFLMAASNSATTADNAAGSSATGNATSAHRLSFSHQTSPHGHYEDGEDAFDLEPTEEEWLSVPREVVYRCCGHVIGRVCLHLITSIATQDFIPTQHVGNEQSPLPTKPANVKSRLATEWEASISCPPIPSFPSMPRLVGMIMSFALNSAVRRRVILTCCAKLQIIDNRGDLEAHRNEAVPILATLGRMVEQMAQLELGQSQLQRDFQSNPGGRIISSFVSVVDLIRVLKEGEMMPQRKMNEVSGEASGQQQQVGESTGFASSVASVFGFLGKSKSDSTSSSSSSSSSSSPSSATSSMFSPSSSEGPDGEGNKKAEPSRDRKASVSSNVSWSDEISATESMTSSPHSSFSSSSSTTTSSATIPNNPNITAKATPVRRQSTIGMLYEKVTSTLFETKTSGEVFASELSCAMSSIRLAVILLLNIQEHGDHLLTLKILEFLADSSDVLFAKDFRCVFFPISSQFHLNFISSRTFCLLYNMIDRYRQYCSYKIPYQVPQKLYFLNVFFTNIIHIYTSNIKFSHFILCLSC